VSTPGFTGGPRGRRPRRAVPWLRSALLGLICLALLTADSGATTLCIAADGSAAIEAAFDGRCDGCDQRLFEPVRSAAPSGSELRAASCAGCVDVDVAGIGRAAGRDPELASLDAVALAPVRIGVAPLAPAHPTSVRGEHTTAASSGSSGRASILRC
jgi:hypothetical protein